MGEGNALVVDGLSRGAWPECLNPFYPDCGPGVGFYTDLEQIVITVSQADHRRAPKIAKVHRHRRRHRSWWWW